MADDQKSDGNLPAEIKEKKKSSTLQSKNIRIHKHRTSVRLEKEMWEALREIAELEECSIHDLCGAVHDLKAPEASFTAALRVFMMEYYRSASRAENPHVLQAKAIAGSPAPGLQGKNSSS
jgi:predicted DNA-binding ribbon-helix-helix protein